MEMKFVTALLVAQTLALLLRVIHAPRLTTQLANITTAVVYSILNLMFVVTESMNQQMARTVMTVTTTMVIVVQ